jgi:cobalt/nickel transport system permease protein
LHFHPSDPYRQIFSPLHARDPRVKVLATVLIVLSTSVSPEGAWASFVFLQTVLVILSASARLGPLYTLRRCWIALPFGMAALSTLFTTPGEPWAALPGLGWPVTQAGLIRFLSILVRALLAVQAAILLTATTRFDDILWALGALRLPGTLLAVISFMYRYLFVLGDEVLRMLRARSARSPSHPDRRGPPLLWRARVAGMMVGSLFVRALERSERVYAAMRARGYRGQVRAIARFRMRPGDWAALATTGLVPVGARLLAAIR